jgi:putative membrane protein
MDVDSLGKHLVSSLVFSLVGLGVFSLGIQVLKVLFPFDMKKEIETDQNTAFGLVIGSFILGLALIVAAAVHG